MGGEGAWSCHGLRRSKTSGRKGELVEQTGRRKKKVIQVRRVSRLWGRLRSEGKLATGEKIVLRMEKVDRSLSKAAINEDISSPKSYC